jgi:hypothetical protein
MRGVLVTVLAAVVVLAGCSDDEGAASAGTTPSTTTTPVPGSTVVIHDDTFVADDVDTLCADLAGLADIDPDLDPTQPDVDRLRAIAETAPDGVAERLLDVAAYGQAIVDGGDGEDTRPAAVDGVVILIAYGNEVCDINVPLFNSIAGV